MPLHKVGVELEGGWTQRPPTEIHTDVSVFADTGWVPPGMQHRGEVSSPPLLATDLLALSSWVFSNYPPFKDITCGMHMHMSVTSDAEYSRLMVKSYVDGLIEHLKGWAKGKEASDLGPCFWPRLNGEQRFCQRVFAPGKQMRAGNKNLAERRAVVNFCWSMHGTVEVRVLPVFPAPSTSLEAITRVMNFTEEFLKKSRAVKEGWRRKSFLLSPEEGL